MPFRAGCPQIYFHDSRDKPIELTHMLQLYPEGHDGVIPPGPLATKPVVCERYDELVFNMPSDGLRQRLSAEVVPSDRGWRSSTNAKHFTDFSADAGHASLQQTYQVITAELQNASKRRVQMEAHLKQLRGEH